MRYLEQAADKDGDARILAAEARLENMEEASPVVPVQLSEESTQGDRLLPLLPKKTIGSRPAIMQRKRKPAASNKESERSSNEVNGHENGTSPAPGTNPPSPEPAPVPESSKSTVAPDPEPTPGSASMPVIPKIEPEIEVSSGQTITSVGIHTLFCRNLIVLVITHLDISRTLAEMLKSSRSIVI